ncbi:MAG: hypothetical protein WBS22_04035, partial [Methylocystis sp.]
MRAKRARRSRLIGRKTAALAGFVSTRPETTGFPALGRLMDCRELAACVRSFAAPQRGGRCKNVDMGVLLIGFDSRRG